MQPLIADFLQAKSWAEQKHGSHCTDTPGQGSECKLILLSASAPKAPCASAASSLAALEDRVPGESPATEKLQRNRHLAPSPLGMMLPLHRKSPVAELACNGWQPEPFQSLRALIKIAQGGLILNQRPLGSRSSET